MGAPSGYSSRDADRHLPAPAGSSAGDDERPGCEAKSLRPSRVVPAVIGVPLLGNIYFAPVAQSAEHPPCKREVVGSSPTRGSILGMVAE